MARLAGRQPVVRSARGLMVRLALVVVLLLANALLWLLIMTLLMEGFPRGIPAILGLAAIGWTA